MNMPDQQYKVPYNCVSISWNNSWRASYAYMRPLPIPSMFQIMACPHFLNPCWLIVNWTLGNIPLWNLNQHTTIVIDENTGGRNPTTPPDIPTHRQTQRGGCREDCPGGPSRHWKKWASWKAQGMVLPAWSFTLPPLVLQIYKISLPRVETIQQHINKYLHKWLGVPPVSQQLASIPQQECSSCPSHPSQKNSRLEKLGSTWCFRTHQTMSYAKYSLKLELEPNGQLLKWCKKQKPASRSKRSLEPPRLAELAQEVPRIDGFPRGQQGP